MGKIKVATGILQGCFGCHIAILDLHEELLDILSSMEIVRSPINDVKDVPEVDVGLLDGSVSNMDNENVAKIFREKSEKIVAFGTCACLGGVPGLRNLFDLQSVLNRGYIETESTVDGKIPSSDEIPKLLPYVKALHQVIDVDYKLPGCPPTPQRIKEFFVSLLNGREPVLPKKNLCHECLRQHKEMYVPKREFITDSVHSITELEHIDETLCFLEQGVLCMGPATREGCDSRCIKGNTPCRGCMGPTDDAMEQGAKMINALATILPAGGLMFLEDVVGVGYRYSMPVSIIPHVMEGK
ncbi:MAG: F420-nonreducing hydrogenase [Nitrospirota bacterium]